jgi:N-acylneuraminate cytidylyltransferase
MTEALKPLAIIPARGSSKRFPRKNIALLAGKPLLAYAVEAALESGVFAVVCVSSEDDEILEAARKYGALAERRPDELALDTAQVKHVCLHLLEKFAAAGQAFDNFGILLPTSPLRTGHDIREAYQVFKQKGANYLMSLVPFSHPPQRALWAPHGYIEPYFGPQYLKQTQFLDPLYRHDGAVIFARSAAFLREKDYYGTKIVPYFMPAERSVDIDNPLDLEWAEFLLSRSRTGK